MHRIYLERYIGSIRQFASGEGNRIAEGRGEEDSSLYF